MCKCAEKENADCGCQKGFLKPWHWILIITGAALAVWWFFFRKKGGVPPVN